MKTLATLVLLLSMAAPATAAVVWNEAVNGDLSTNPAAPTPIVFALGDNTITGTVKNSTLPNPTGDRDFITFQIPNGSKLVALNLLSFAPVNTCFSAFNAGVTSFVPSESTDPFFLAGIHIEFSYVGTNLLPIFSTLYVTSNGLPAPELGPGNYCFVIQQTSNLTTSYSLSFVLDASVPADRDTWGAIKALYR